MILHEHEVGMINPRKSNTCSDFQNVCTSVQGVLEMFSALRYVHKSKLQQFSFDITAIAFALRCVPVATRKLLKH